MKYDYLIVGAGLFGSIFAREAANRGKHVLVIDRRNHIGGNVFTEVVDGIPVHKYGAHIFHTSQQYIWEYVTQYADFNNYSNRVKAISNGRLYTLPINLLTLNQVWPDIVTPAQAIEKLSAERIAIKEPKNLEEFALSQIGPTLYELFIKGYTQKQWGCSPCELPASIIKRIPVRLNMNDRYFHDSHRWEGIPKGGYTPMIENILKGIEVRLNTDFLNDRRTFENISNMIVYSGPLDSFFNYSEGRLDYRSLSFEQSTHVGDYQGNAVINYCDLDIPYTRILEHKHFDMLESDRTVITREYPCAYNGSNEPYYPMNNYENNTRYEKYRLLGNKCSNFIFGGRLANYRYYDMDMTVANALSVVSKYL
jgi:UDP-galactopyranose mutase